MPDDATERKQAQQVFEAKEMDVNPRKPFYITVGALVLFGICTAIYFWYEMQPKNNYKIPPPSAQPAPAPAAAAPMAAAPAPGSGAPTTTTGAPPAAAPPGADVAQGAAPPAKAGAAAPATAAAGAAPKGAAAPTRGATAARPAPTRAPATAQPPAAKREGEIKITPARVRTDPVLESAYQAFNSGDLTQARENYQQVLRANPDSRDALLGMAAVEMQARHYQAAGSIYTRLLELDPRDAHAQAGLIGLKGETDPLTTESRLKNMIAAQPEANFLHFTLGNQYAAQGRWAEAQQAYFRAYTGDPEHPDFAYNLAVSLDKLHQSRQALDYYRRALKLAEGHPVTFDRAQVGKRVSQLAGAP